MSVKLEKQFGKSLNWLFELRNVGDYGETRHVTEKEVTKALSQSQEFCNKIRELLAE